jgi:hypothetical protein
MPAVCRVSQLCSKFETPAREEGKLTSSALAGLEREGRGEVGGGAVLAQAGGCIKLELCVGADARDVGAVRSK